MPPIELSTEQAVVLGCIKYNFCISPLEMTYHIDFSQQDIEQAVKFLESHHLIYLANDGGYPKRYKAVELPAVPEEVAEDIDRDYGYEDK